MKVEQLSLPGGRRLLLSDSVIDRSNATVVDGLLIGLASGPRSVGVKLDTPRRLVGNHIESERRFYEEAGKAASLSLAIPRYFGSVRRSGEIGLVLERALFPLDRVCGLRAADDPAIASLIATLSALLAARLVGTLRALAGSKHARGRGVGYVAHRDIRLENMLGVERDGVIDIVLADWGLVRESSMRTRGPDGDMDVDRGSWTLAPEQRGDDTAEKVQSSLETDLWAVGLAVWQLLHRGALPLRLTEDGPLISADSPLMREPHTVFVVDVEGCTPQSGCLLAGREHADPIHTLASRLLTSHLTPGTQRSDIAEEAWPALEEIQDALLLNQQKQLVSPDSGAPLYHQVFYANVVSGGHLLFAEPPRAQAYGHDLSTDSSRASRSASRLAALVGPRELSRLLGVVAAIFVGIGLGLSTTIARQWQVMPLPDPLIDTAQSWVVIGAVAVLAIGLGALRLRIRQRSGPGYRREIDVVAVAVAGAAGALTIVGLTLTRHFAEPWYVWATDAIAVASLSASVASLLPLGRPAPTKRTLSARRGPRVASILSAVGALVVPMLAVVTIMDPAAASAMANHAVPTHAIRTIAGTPHALPAFFNPYSMAVSDDGDVVALEEYAVGEDDIWLFPHDGSSPRVVFRSYPLATAPSAIQLTALQQAAAGAVRPSTGVRVSSIAAVAFLGSDLVVIGSEGITRLNISGSVTTTTRITTKVTVARGDRLSGLLLTQEGHIFVDGAKSNVKPPTLRTCDSMNYGSSDIADYVVEIDSDGNAKPYTWTDSEGECTLNVWDLASYDGGVGVYGVLYQSGAEVPFIASLNGTNIRTFDNPSYEDGFGRVTVAGDRVFGTSNRCLIGFPLAKDTPMPKVVDEASYNGANHPYCDPAAAGFLGSVSAAEFTWKENPSECSKPQPGTGVLTTSGWNQTPMTVDKNGTLYVFSLAGPGCTLTLWSMAKDQTTWKPSSMVTTEPSTTKGWKAGRTTIMAAVSPSYSGDLLGWRSDEYGNLTSSSAANNSYPHSPSYTILSPIRQLTFGEVTVELGHEYKTHVPTLSFMRGGRSSNDGVPIPGATDIASGPDGRLIIARCGQLLSLDPNNAAFVASESLLDPKNLPITVLAGRDVAPTAKCAPIRSAPSDVHAGLVSADIAPTSVAVRQNCAKCDPTYVISEVGSFGGQKVSRISTVDPKSARIATVGYTNDGRNPSGDLASLGLVATDVAINASGQIAVTTMSTRGYGPVLLFVGGHRSVVSMPSNVLEPSGVTWMGKNLVVTDAASGNVVELTFH